MESFALRWESFGDFESFEMSSEVFELLPLDFEAFELPLVLFDFAFPFLEWERSLGLVGAKLPFGLTGGGNCPFGLTALLEGFFVVGCRDSSVVAANGYATIGGT